MFPQSQMDKTQYAVSSQLPTGAQTIASDYDTPTNSYTGLPLQKFDEGGDVALEAPVEEQRPLTMDELAAQLNEYYRSNQNYDDTWKQFAATKEQDPEEWYRKQLGFLGGQEGWQIGQNTSERNAALQPQIQDTIAQARAAGLGEEEIAQIMGSSQQSANYANQQRIANQAAAGGGMFNGIEGLAMPAATMLALGTGQAWALPLINAGISAAQGADPTKIAMNAALSYALPGIAEGLPGGMEALQGINTAKSIYNVAQNPSNPMAAYGAAKNVYNFANSPMFAAKGGLMASGGIADLGSYSDGGRLLKGPGDGMSDHIPATIGAKQPARLAEGEFVVPADVVSHLGNGSTDAGAKQLYKMMDNIRKARTGNPKQGKQINPDKFTPKG
jgi:hypothetical protein